jgi:hypothetical protein
MKQQFRRIRRNSTDWAPSWVEPRIQTQGDMVRASIVLPGGHRIVRTIRAHHATLAGDEIGGKFLRKLKKGLKKTGKGILTGAKFVHKITHKGPLGKLEKQAQKLVGQVLPFTRPFIAAHNKLSAPIHKALEGKSKSKVQAAAIKAVTKKLPPAQRPHAQKALAASFAHANALQAVAKATVKAKVVAAAAKAAKAGNPTAKRVLKAAAVYKVTLPNGKVVPVPASKVH